MVRGHLPELPPGHSATWHLTESPPLSPCSLPLPFPGTPRPCPIASQPRPCQAPRPALPAAHLPPPAQPGVGPTSGREQTSPPSALPSAGKPPCSCQALPPRRVPGVGVRGNDRARAEPARCGASPPQGAAPSALPSASLDPPRFSPQEEAAAPLRPAVPHRILGAAPGLGPTTGSGRYRQLPARNQTAPLRRAPPPPPNGSCINGRGGGRDGSAPSGGYAHCGGGRSARLELPSASPMAPQLPLPRRAAPNSGLVHPSPECRMRPAAEGGGRCEHA